MTSLSALLNVVAAFEEILHDHAALLRRHVHALDRDHRADGMHPVDPLLDLGLLGRDGGRRRDHLADELGNHRRLEEEIEPSHGPEEQGDDGSDDEKTLNHGLFWFFAGP